MPKYIGRHRTVFMASILADRFIILIRVIDCESKSGGVQYCCGSYLPEVNRQRIGILYYRLIYTLSAIYSLEFSGSSLRPPIRRRPLTAIARGSSWYPAHHLLRTMPAQNARRLTRALAPLLHYQAPSSSWWIAVLLAEKRYACLPDKSRGHRCFGLMSSHLNSYFQSPRV